MNDYPRGSEWRRWDLHLHTPETARYDNFTGKTTEAKWKNFTKTINDYSDDVAVVGITDYFSINNYYKFKKLVDDGTISKKFDLILPNVELRILPVTSGAVPVNIHCIFSPDIVKELETRFFGKLKFQASDTEYTCTKSDLIRLGRVYNPRIRNDDEAYKIGREQFVIGYDRLIEIFKHDPDLRNKTVIVVSNNTSDGASGIRSHEDYLTNGGGSQLDATRQAIYQNADCIFSSNPNDRTFFLGQKTSIKDVIEKCGRLKACVHGCDAHENSKVFEPDKKRYCWVKANPTFAGLKQIIYEPGFRTRIQTENPDTKKPYFVIDKVRYIDNSGETFPNNYTLINPDLTTIIGGKSTGKSLMLYYIAKTIDSKEVDERLNIEGVYEPPYNFDEDPHFDFEVVWRDGQTQTLKQDPDDADSSDRKILYIPQNYLNKLSERNLHSKLTLNDFVLNVLLQEQSANEKYIAHQKHIGVLKKNIQNELTDLFQLLEDGKELAEALKQKGDLAGVKKYISTLKAEIKTIKEKSGLNKNQMQTYEKKSNLIEEHTERVSELEDDKDSVIALHEALIEQTFGFKEILDEYNEVINTNSVKERLKKELGFIRRLEPEVNNSQQKLIKTIDTEIKAQRVSIKKLKTELKPLESKVKLHSSLNIKNQALAVEQTKLNSIQLDQKKLEAKRRAYTTKLEVIFGYYSEIYKSYESITKEFALYDNHFDDISLNVVTEFKSELFDLNVVNEYLNKSDLKRIDKETTANGEYSYSFDPTTHLTKIDTIYRALVSGGVKTVKNRSIQDAATHLLEDLFYLDFKISYKGDSLQKMSPGKKGLVLLRLLIDLSDEEWPILLDQPEDDLDNRSIYNELAIYLMNKKQNRQILIVTHNPNLVVTTDSEEVIVANQGNQEVGRENRKYRFEYISGALENTFEKTIAEEASILYRKGIREHTCEILEGGEEAFAKREEKYSLSNKK